MILVRNYVATLIKASFLAASSAHSQALLIARKCGALIVATSLPACVHCALVLREFWSVRCFQVFSSVWNSRSHVGPSHLNTQRCTLCLSERRSNQGASEGVMSPSESSPLRPRHQGDQDDHLHLSCVKLLK